MKYLRHSLTLLVATAAVAGCASRSAPTVKNMQPVATVTPAPAEPSPTAEAATPMRPYSRPALEKAYFVGRIVDPEHPELMYGDGVVFRREMPARWDTDGAGFDQRGFQTGPITSIRNGAEHPEATPADQEIFRARTNEIINALLTQNSQLADKLAKVTKGITELDPRSAQNGLNPPSTAPASISPALSPALATAGSQIVTDTNPTVTLAPSADNIIELSPALLEPPVPGMTNPFRQRYRYKVELHETKVTIGGISLGEKPVCLIDDKLYAIGDTFETFKVAGIDAEGIFLQKDAFMLRIPMQDEAITLRYP